MGPAMVLVNIALPPTFRLPVVLIVLAVTLPRVELAVTPNAVKLAMGPVMVLLKMMLGAVTLLVSVRD